MYSECLRKDKEGCPFADTDHCRANTHHKYWPKPDYKTRTERQFRELPVNKEQVCLWEHRLLHELVSPPHKPSLPDMLSALGRLANEA